MGVHELNEVQAQALEEAYDTHSLFLVAPQGSGKTLLSGLLATVLGTSRAVLVVPGGLLDKTATELAAYDAHWRIGKYEILSYEFLAQAHAVDELLRLAPQLIVCDEGQRVKSLKAAVTRRISRYKEEYPETVYCDLSGTPIKRSLLDLGHRMEWAKGADIPLPRRPYELREWAGAVDEGVPDYARVAPGVLGKSLDTARRALGERIFSVPGVIRTSENYVDAPLTITLTDLPLRGHENELFEHLRQWETPDGVAIATAVDIWRHAREAALGFYQRWKPSPPKWWLEPRAVWASRVRKFLSHSSRFDTEKQVFDQAANPKHPLHLAREEWLKVKDKYEYETEVIWFGDTALLHAEHWLRTHERGIAWVEHVPFGQELARRSGLRYHRNHGLAADGTRLDWGSGARISSIHANKFGWNLQPWTDSLLTSAPPTGLVWDQVIARHHRQGQKNQVNVYVPISCREQAEAYAQARADGEMHNGFLDSPAKLLIGKTTVPAFSVRGAAWKE